MPRTLTVHKDKRRPVGALWWRPLFNMQREMNRNLSRMSWPFLPPDAWMGGEELFDAFEQNVHRLFSESFNMRQMLIPWFMGSHTAPYVDIVENGGGYVVYADMPGLAEENIDISAAEDALIIEGRKERHKAVDGEHYIRRECCTAPFRRTVALPEDADPGNAQAIFKHNVLIVDVPKKERAERKSRKLKAGNGEKKGHNVARMQEKKAA